MTTLASEKKTNFANKAALQSAAAKWMAERISDAISRRGRAIMMASGGSTPGPAYTQLACANLDWSAVTVGLADERWVDAGHPNSNGAMLQQTLLQGAAAQAEYLPMKSLGNDPFTAVDTVNDRYKCARNTDVLILGMGPDAHTLSWFSGARGFERAVDPHTAANVAAIEANETEVTGPITLRMTLTYPCVATARNVLLLITGANKAQVFESALATSPVGRMTKAAGAALTVFYAD